jgi:hypothetical protein
MKDSRLLEVFFFLREAGFLNASSVLKFMRNENKIRRRNGDNEPNSNGHIYFRWTLRSFTIAKTLDQYSSANSSGDSQRAY